MFGFGNKDKQLNRLKINSTTTKRGFKSITFNDNYGEECSLQESSSVEPSIWLGIDKVKPKMFLPKVDPTRVGWIDYPLPDAVETFGRMNLNQKQVQELLPYLEYFAINGNLPSEEELNIFLSDVPLYDYNK